MSLRRHINSDYFLSLFAGVRSATTAPPGTYNMDDPLGRGACGIGVASNGAVTPPTITAPTAHVLVEPDDTISASAFSATGGLTHRASRWFIEDCSGGDVGTPSSSSCETPGCYWFNTGLDVGHYPTPASACAGTATLQYSYIPGAHGVLRTVGGGTIFCDIYDNDNVFVVGSSLEQHGTDTVIPEVVATPPTCGGGNLVYDSGATTAHKTSLPLVLAPLQPNRSYRIRVRYQASDGTCSGYSDWVPLVMSATCLDCVALPPPPAPAPPPPAPPPAPPPTVDGFSAMAVDLGSSYIMGDLDACLNSPIMLPEIMARGGKQVGVAATVFLAVRNLSSSPITGAVHVRADNLGLGWMDKPAGSFTPTIPPLPHDFPVTLAANQSTQVKFQLVTIGFVSGSYVVSIDTGSGIPFTFNLGAFGVAPCTGSPGDTGAGPGDGGA